MPHQYDIIIIGAGVIGCAIAGELSRYEASIAVLEKECDAGYATSSRNSGVVHAGFNCEPGTLKAGLCTESCRKFESFCGELGVLYKKTGKLVTALSESDMPGLLKLKEAGEKNGVLGLEIIDSRRIKELEPNVSGIAALYSPWTAVTNPIQLTIALAENAHLNGTSFFFESPVTKIKRRRGLYEISVDHEKKPSFESKYVINCAGLNSDKIAALAGDTGWRIYPCRGEYFVLDKNTSALLGRPVYPVPRPGEGGLGVHLTTTVDGNILIGPSSEYVRMRLDYSTTSPVMKKLWKEAESLLPLLEKSAVIRSFSGMRPKLAGKKKGGFDDFVIKESDKNENLFHLIGIESPGLTSAPAIAEMTAGLVTRKETFKKKTSCHIHKLRRPLSSMNEEEQSRLIKEDPDSGEVICRCEHVTKRDILSALENPFGATTLKSIKNRTRATTGRCQGGFCTTRIVSLLENRYGIPPGKMSFAGKGSHLFTGRVK